MRHLKKNNETYFSHFFFAGKVGLNLIFHGVVFLLHGIFPFCSIPERWNLSSMTYKIQEWNRYTIMRLDK